MKRLAILVALLATPALAQQPSAAEQALSERLIAEIQSNVQARAQLIETQRKLAEAEAKIRAQEVAKADQGQASPK